MSSLAEIAARTKQAHMKVQDEPSVNVAEIVEETEYTPTASPVIVDTDDDDEPVVMMGDVIASTDNNGVVEELSEEDLNDIPFGLSDDELREIMKDMDEESFKESTGRIRAAVEAYRKSLIIDLGLTVDEATSAAIQRMKKLGTEENDNYVEEHPNLAIVKVDKTNVDNLEFTASEREKLSKVRAIKLEVVEDMSLKTLSIERIDKKNKSEVLQTIDSGLSHYSVPLPVMSDYCRFKGAQTITLIQAVKYDDATPDEIINKKASLIYNQLAHGSNLKKFDGNGKTIMTYRDFINKFLFHDLDMALYGILVASSMETIDSQLTCSNCNQPFTWSYNLKTLLNLDDLNDDFKDKFEDILGHKSDDEYLTKLYDENHKSVRVQSPLTHNVYELNYPTVARAINLLRLVDSKDETMLYLSAFALFISKLYVYNPKTEKHIEIEEDEYRLLLETLQIIPQEEIDLIQEFLKPYIYTPKFILHSTCSKCGQKMKNNLSIDDLVFLKARDSSTEITQ